MLRSFPLNIKTINNYSDGAKVLKKKKNYSGDVAKLFIVFFFYIIFKKRGRHTRTAANVRTNNVKWFLNVIKLGYRNDFRECLIIVVKQ